MHYELTLLMNLDVNDDQFCEDSAIILRKLRFY